MKNLSRILIVTLALVAMLGMTAFAEEDITVKERVEQLKEEGYERSEIGDILKAEGFELKSGPLKIANRNFVGNIKSEFAAERTAIKEKIDALKAEGFDLEQIKEKLSLEGIELGNFNFVKYNEEAAALVKELQAEGLTREEISAKLKEAGLVQEKPFLTEEKKAELDAIKTQVNTWREEGLDRQEIFQKLLDAGLINQDQMPKKFTMSAETLEQIQALKEQGLTRQEIKESLE